MATAHIPPPPRPSPRYTPEPDVPHFEQLEGRWTWERLVALASLSVLTHVVLALLIVAAVVAMPKNSPIVLTTRELLREDNVFLTAPPDTQKPRERPETNVLSDKDRVQSTRVPRPDRKTLNELADNLRPGAPAPPAGAPSASPPMQAALPPAQKPPLAPGGGLTPSGNDAQLRLPNTGARRLPDFGAPATAGSVVQEAARAASGQRGGSVDGGEYGSGPGLAATPHRGDFEILSDTLGVDFAPYMKRMRITIYNNWMAVMPESAFPPWRKRGTVVIEFSVLKDGTITGVRLVSSSGDVSLDRAAYAAITASNILSALPADFRGDYLTIRAIFHYNPDRNTVR